jgi:hypothetical protein
MAGSTVFLLSHIFVWTMTDQELLTIVTDSSSRISQLMMIISPLIGEYVWKMGKKCQFLAINVHGSLFNTFRHRNCRLIVSF